MIKRSYNQAYFENIFYKATPASARDTKRAHLIRQYKSSGTLLDIGCSEGYLLQLLADDFNVHGLEVSEYACHRANSLFKSTVVSCQDITHAALDADHFDVMVAFNLLEHLAAPQQVVAKLFHALKPGGVLVGSVPNNQEIIGRFFTVCMNLIDRTHVSTLPVKEWQNLFHQQGFLPLQEFGEIPFLRNYAHYFTHSLWPVFSTNYLFVYQKPAPTDF